MKGVISGFSETGTDKVPDLSAEKCRTDFNSLQKSLDKLMDIPERRDELEDMLALWAGIGMGKLVHGDSSAEGSDLEDINIIL
jgi:predicted nuclease with TOPRIM domain